MLIICLISWKPQTQLTWSASHSLFKTSKGQDLSFSFEEFLLHLLKFPHEILKGFSLFWGILCSSFFKL